MARRSSSSSEVLLGLLTIEPMSGYDLGQLIRISVGHFWRESYGQIYPNLKKLAAEGLVTAKTERQKGKPDRRIYSITNKGREQLANGWPWSRSPRFRAMNCFSSCFLARRFLLRFPSAYLERMVEEEGALLKRVQAGRAGDRRK